MKYSMTRKINLGKYGLDYESLDIGVEGCETKIEAMQEITEWKAEIIEALKPKDPFPDDTVKLTKEEEDNLPN